MFQYDGIVENKSFIDPAQRTSLIHTSATERERLDWWDIQCIRSSAGCYRPFLDRLGNRGMGLIK